MRLTKDEIRIIKETIRRRVDDAKITLFGSRVYDDKKGGDIDILVQTDKKVSLKKQLEILSELEIKGIERKVDLLFQTPYTKEQNIFKTAKNEGILL